MICKVKQTLAPCKGGMFSCFEDFFHLVPHQNQPQKRHLAITISSPTFVISKHAAGPPEGALFKVSQKRASDCAVQESCCLACASSVFQNQPLRSKRNPKRWWPQMHLRQPARAHRHVVLCEPAQPGCASDVQNLGGSTTFCSE